MSISRLCCSSCNIKIFQQFKYFIFLPYYYDQELSCLLFSRRHHEYPCSWIKNAFEHKTKDCQERFTEPTRINAINVLVAHGCPQIYSLVIEELELVVGIERAQVVYELVRVHPPIGNKFLQVGKVLPHAFLADVIEHHLVLCVDVLANEAIE